MKKVAGTLKLDQAQYRELEAFSKFGSDLDASTKNVIDKGQRNVEILKQGQYSPVSVEKQVAIVYAGTKNLMRAVPVNKIKAFEAEYTSQLELRHPEVLAGLKAGKLDDSITSVLETVAKGIVRKILMF
jgi:F-type H+-transporting ATPase subunit alpha